MTSAVGLFCRSLLMFSGQDCPRCPCHHFLGISALVSFPSELEDPCLLCSQLQGPKLVLISEKILSPGCAAWQGWASVSAEAGEQTPGSVEAMVMVTSSGTVIHHHPPETRRISLSPWGSGRQVIMTSIRHPCYGLEISSYTVSVLFVWSSAGISMT